MWREAKTDTVRSWMFNRTTRPSGPVALLEGACGAPVRNTAAERILGGLVDQQQGPHPPHGQQLGTWGDRGLINSVFCSKSVAGQKHLLAPVTRKWATFIPKLPQTDPNG